MSTKIQLSFGVRQYAIADGCTYATLGEMWKSYRHDITVIGNVFEPQYTGKTYEQVLNELNKSRR